MKSNVTPLRKRRQRARKRPVPDASPSRPARLYDLTVGMLPLSSASLDDGYDPARRLAILRAEELGIFMMGSATLLRKDVTDDPTVKGLIAGVNDLWLRAYGHNDPQLLARMRLVDLVEGAATMETLDRDGARAWSRESAVVVVRRTLQTQHPELDPHVSNAAISSAISACRGFNKRKWDALRSLCIEAGCLRARSTAGTLKREHIRWKRRSRPILGVRLE